MMKKLTIFVLSVFMILSLTGCNSNGKQSSTMTKEKGSSINATVQDVRDCTENRNNTMTEKYKVGDIILADNSVIKPEELTTIDSSNLPVSVIAGIKNDGTALGVGVHTSNGCLSWAPDGTNGYATKFTDTICIQMNSEDDDTAEFTGDMDGSDNWAVISSQDEKGVTDVVNNYPAFDFVNTYAETYKLTDSYATGWYMPSIAELCTVYENEKEINVSLQKIYELDNSAAVNGLDTNWYWASSQSDSKDDYAWFVHFYNGYAGECPKNFTNVHVLVVRAFKEAVDGF